MKNLYKYGFILVICLLALLQRANAQDENAAAHEPVSRREARGADRQDFRSTGWEPLRGSGRGCSSPARRCRSGGGNVRG